MHLRESFNMSCMLMNCVLAVVVASVQLIFQCSACLSKTKICAKGEKLFPVLCVKVPLRGLISDCFISFLRL